MIFFVKTIFYKSVLAVDSVMQPLVKAARKHKKHKRNMKFVKHSAARPGSPKHQTAWRHRKH